MQAPLSGRHSAGARNSGKHSTANGPLPPGNLRISQDFQLSKRALKLWRDEAALRKRMAARFFEFAVHRKSRHGCGGDRQGGKAPDCVTSCHRHLVSEETNRLTPLCNGLVGTPMTTVSTEIAPLGLKAGAPALRIGNLLIRALEPLVYGLEKSADWIQMAVSERLNEVPQENIVAPDPRIAVPVLQALTYSIGDKTISEMFANLLAADMNSETKSKVHPAFVEMIKEISPADAKVLSVLAGGAIEFQARLRAGDKWVNAGYSTSVEVPGLDTDNIRRALSNLKRLEIVEGRDSVWPVIEGMDQSEADLRRAAEPRVSEMNAMPEETKAKIGWSEGSATIDIHKVGVYITPLGEDFAAICMSKTEA